MVVVVVIGGCGGGGVAVVVVSGCGGVVWYCKSATVSVTVDCPVNGHQPIYRRALVSFRLFFRFLTIG